MKLLFLMFVTLALVGCADDGTPSEPPPLPELPERISMLPNMIRVVPESGPIVWAQESKDPSHEYVWRRTLYVFVEEAPVRIVEFGVYALIDGAWVEANDDGRAHDGDTFSKWFRCDDAQLERGRVFRSEMFSTAGDAVPEEGAVYRWYFIGDGPGGLCRGEVTVTNLPPDPSMIIPEFSRVSADEIPR